MKEACSQSVVTCISRDKIIGRHSAVQPIEMREIKVRRLFAVRRDRRKCTGLCRVTAKLTLNNYINNNTNNNTNNTNNDDKKKKQKKLLGSYTIK